MRRLGNAPCAGCEPACLRDAMVRMLDHTADIGFELAAPTLEALFDEARQALLMTLFEEPPKGGEEERLVRLSGPTVRPSWCAGSTSLSSSCKRRVLSQPGRSSGSGRTARKLCPSKHVFSASRSTSKATASRGR